MIGVLARNWWAVELRGVLAIIIGILAFALPGVTLASLVLLFGIYMLIDGIFAIIAAVRAASEGARWWPMVLEGAVDIIAGAIALAWPVVTVLAFVYLSAAWAIISGAILLGGAFQQRHVFLGIAGLFSLIWGFVIAFYPDKGALVLVWLFGAYALIFGGALIAAGLQLRTLRRPDEEAEPYGHAYAGDRPRRPPGY